MEHACADTPPTASGRYGEPIDRPTPPIPTGNDRTDDLTAFLRDDQRLRVVADETAQALDIVGVSRLGVCPDVRDRTP